MNILQNLQTEEKYVFHGSGSHIEEFEPRQAHTIINGEKVPDGRPAIHASPFIDYAIFMAIFNKENCPKGYRAGVSYNGNFEFTATKETLAQVTPETKGYVYIFHRDDFEKKNNSEWVCFKKVKPFMRIEVSREDFLHSIVEIPNDI